MSGGLIVTHVFSLEQDLRLVRTSGVPGGREAGTPAVLTISRGGWPLEPRLVLFGDRDTHGAARLGSLTFSDSHVVTGCEDQADQGRRELADVLTDTAFRVPFGVRDRLRRRLERYPGCSVAVARRRGGQLALVRDAATVATRSSSGADEEWAALCGSFLYCWSAAGLGLAELPKAALIVGRFTEDPGVLETVGRVQATVVPTGPAARRLAS